MGDVSRGDDATSCMEEPLEMHDVTRKKLIGQRQGYTYLEEPLLINGGKW